MGSRVEGRILDNVTEVYPNLYVAGMAANAVHGSRRMGPLFGGMLYPVNMSLRASLNTWKIKNNFIIFK